MTNVSAALDMVVDGMTLGLGSGHASERFVEALGARVKTGLRVRGVPTSKATAELAIRAGIDLVELADGMPIDIAFDGADEVDPGLDMIKGYGHALIRERVVAAASRKLVILIGPEHAEEKLVARLGQRGILPVEVIPFALPLCLRRVAELGFSAEPVRNKAGDLFAGDNGNYILHLSITAIPGPRVLESALKDIPGVVGTGLFLGMADIVLIEHEGSVEIRARKSRSLLTVP